VSSQPEAILLTVIDLSHEGADAFLIQTLGDEIVAKLAASGGSVYRFLFTIQVPVRQLRMSAAEHTVYTTNSRDEYQLLLDIPARLRYVAGQVQRDCHVKLRTLLREHIERKVIALHASHMLMVPVPEVVA
jgi:hypothetical protein